MNTHKYIVRGAMIAMVLGGTVAHSQVVNQWRGGETAEDWNDQYKWKQKHTPTSEEAAHFREPISIINLNSTVQLNNGMHLYGEELSLQGNGNINLHNPVPHQRTVNIPASATGFANMTLNDNLSLNGRIALSAKGFGTSASKGSITLKNRANVTGALCIGNAGTGTGLVFIKDNASYRITGLELATKAANGGSAEIHILSGTVRIETKDNPFDAFLQDSSRKLVLGEAGTLRVEHTQPVARKKEALKAMILKDHLVAAPGCRLMPPVIQDKLVIIRAEDERNDSAVKTKEALIAAIDRISAASVASSSGSQPRKLESLLQTMRSGSDASAPAATAPAPSGSGGSLAALMQQKGVSAETPPSNEAPRLVGYIAFVGAAMLILRRSPVTQEEETTPAKKQQKKNGKRKKR